MVLPEMLKAVNDLRIWSQFVFLDTNYVLDSENAIGISADDLEPLVYSDLQRWRHQLIVFFLNEFLNINKI